VIVLNRVLAAIDAKMVKPAPDRPYEGMITIHSEISPMASTEYEQGRCVRRLLHLYKGGINIFWNTRTSDEEVTITRMLDKVIRRSDALDKESLCIVAGQRVSSA